MKKIIFCIVFFIFATGCNIPVKTVAPILEDIGFNLDVSYYNENYILKGETKVDDLSLTVTEPEELNGMEITVNDGKLTLKYKELTYSPDGNELYGNIGLIIEDIFESAKKIKPEAKTDGNYIIKDTAEGKNYIFTFSPQGYPLKLEVNSEGFVAEFSNVTLKES